MADRDQQKVTRQNQLEKILRFKGRFKGSLSICEDFGARKALERDCAAAVAPYESAVIKESFPDDEFLIASVFDYYIFWLNHRQRGYYE